MDIVYRFTAVTGSVDSFFVVTVGMIIGLIPLRQQVGEIGGHSLQIHGRHRVSG